MTQPIHNEPLDNTSPITGWENEELILPIDWNTIVDQVDKSVWDRLTGNFWLPEKIPLSNDLTSWRNLSEAEKVAVKKVFAGLTLLDTLQGKIGAVSLIPDALTPHEEAVYTNIAFMEEVHAKSYSSIFSTFLYTKEIKDTFQWCMDSPHLKKKQAIIKYFYNGSDPAKKKIASTLLESFLFYSGFYLIFWLASRGKLTNTADIIRLILRDEGVHGYYIGYKLQKYLELHPERYDELHQFSKDLLKTLMDNESKYTEDIYDPIGITSDVKAFLRYNAVKAFQNLGFPDPYTPAETRVSASIMASLSPAGEESHDFFSGNGSTYVMGASKIVDIDDDDWDDIMAD